MTQMELSTKQKQTHRHKGTDLWLTRGRGKARRIGLGVSN